jgi:DNA-directed RNA polymerase specialized sigma24 family protein
MLSPQQLRIVKLRTRGLSNKEIASQLGIAEGTVKVYMTHAARKTGVNVRGLVHSVIFDEYRGRLRAFALRLFQAIEETAPDEKVIRTIASDMAQEALLGNAQSLQGGPVQ